MSNLGLQMQYTIIMLKCPLLQIPAVQFIQKYLLFSLSMYLDISLYQIASVQTGSHIVASLAP